MKKIKNIISIYLCLLISMPVEAGIQKAFSIYQDKQITATDKIEKITYELIESKYYFSASIMAAKRLEKDAPLNMRFKKALEELSIKVGIDFVWDTTISPHHKDATISFSLGLKAFREQKYQEAKNLLILINKDDKYFPEAKMILGTILSLESKKAQAKEQYNLCINAASAEGNKGSNEKQARYYHLIAEDCQINIARDTYRSGKFKESVDEFNKITKNSYRWPYLLLEKAWAFYQLGDYNRTLGLLVTYKSPLLESYFFPEAEALAALSYFKLCLWDDTNIIINRYYSDYKNKATELKQFIDLNKSKPNFYYQMAMKKDELSNSTYAQNLLVQVKKQVKYSLDILPIQRGEKELAQLMKQPHNVFTDYLQKKVSNSIEVKKAQLNQFIAHNMYDFLNQIHRYSRELFIIQLEVLAQKRTMLYQEEKLISNRSRGDLSNVKRETTQHFWDFSGAFWADELGEYSFGLKSNCQRVRSTNEKN